MSALTRAVAGGMTPLLLCTSALRAQDYSWPRQTAVSAGTIVLYQPQAEKLIGNELTARGAIALKVTGRADPIFGAMWMTATVDVDRDSGIVWLTNLKVTRVRWPDAKPEQQQRFTQFVESDFPTTGFRTTLARFQASLASAEAERTHTEGLKADAPKIVFVEQLAVLLLYDGEPRTKPIENTGLAVVINTPFGVIKDTASGTYWLGGGKKVWYSATDAKGPWTAGGTPPDDILKMAPADTASARADTSTARADTSPHPPPPVIVTATEPTELVVTQGPPKWQTTAGGKLLYVENTETPWIRETEGQYNYLLIAGRWFRSSSTLGPWSSVRADSLPKAFQDIPAESPIGGVRSSVALTVEAQDALLDLEIPQTTAVQRSKATLTVKYDGEPKFTDIAGTSVAYAVNTQSQVLRVAGAYFAYPVTYGVAVSYNPYTGYGMGATWATGFFAFSVGFAIGNSHNYYPAGGYRSCFNCTVNVNRGNNNVNIGNSAGGGNRQRPGNRPSQQPANSNLYNRPENKARTANHGSRDAAAGQRGANQTARGSNNVFADPNGGVHRRTQNGGWESREGGGWSQDRSAGNRGMEREYQARQRSSTRSSGGARGGGGRRR